MAYELTLTETLQKETRLDPSLLVDSWEVGRLVLDPAVRQGQDLLKQCLILALGFVAENSNGRNFHASCTHVLSRLYRRFGFSIVATDIPLAGTEKTYTLIHGTVANVSRALMGNDAVSAAVI
jgi:predicted GNAT family N-acyltransferase